MTMDGNIGHKEHCKVAVGSLESFFIKNHSTKDLFILRIEFSWRTCNHLDANVRNHEKRIRKTLKRASSFFSPSVNSMIFSGESL